MSRADCRHGKNCGYDPCPIELDIPCKDFEDRPHFIPLETEHYRAFENGTKTKEYRPRGDRWNKGTCWIGRRVVLSRGYSTPDRMNGRIVSVEVISWDESPDAYRMIYSAEKYKGKHIGKPVMAIGIEIESQVVDGRNLSAAAAISAMQEI